MKSVAIMKVCRVCLAMGVKMYHMPEHKLSDMYERVTGVEINSEDKLPKMICWECVARLSSANNFIEKALKTQWILLKKIIGSNITMSDIASIDRAQHQLESTLGLKYYEVNNTDLHIQRESDITGDDHDASCIELSINKYEGSEWKDFENFTIKSELLDITEQPKEADLHVTKPTIFIKKNESGDEVTIDTVSNASEMSEDENLAVHKDREICEGIKQERKDFSATPLSYRSTGLPYEKDLRVVTEDAMLSLREQNTQDSFNEVTNNYISCLLAQSVENKESVTHLTINGETLTYSNKMDTHSMDTIEAAKCIFPGLENSQRCDAINTNKTFYATTGAINIDFTHYDAESSKKIFICDICKKSFQFKKYLKQHIQGHFNLFYCTYCRYKTCRKLFLTKHVNTKHIKNNSFKCSYCSYKVCNKSDLNKHVNRKHTKHIVLNCSYCSYKTYDTSSLRKHVNNKHTKNNVHNCSYCSYKAYGKSALNQHVNAKHTKKLVFDCSYCDYKAYRKSHLTDHVNAIHTKNTVFNCSYCDYTTFNKRHLSRHVNAIHTKNVVFDCSLCDYISYSKSNLTRHIKTKHTKNIVYNCSHCSYKAYSKRVLNHHVKAIHTKKTVVYCAHCDYKSCRKSTLTKHINTMHTKNTVYNCSYCRYKAYSKSTLTKHINTKHTKNIAFYCAHCSYKAHHKNNLCKHIKSKHNNL